MNSSLELSLEESTSFKFPFTDKEDADLNLSANYGKVRRSLRLAKKKSSELGLALSPIAMDRESTSSIMGYVEGDSLCLSDIDSAESDNDKPQTPLGYFEESKKSMEEQEIDELPEMKIPRTESLEDAMKQVGEHSNDFIGKMRDAANKRKAAVTRSRDFLVAREQEQIRSIAECESRLTTLKQKLENAGETNKENEPFQQIRKKANKTINGFGGVGVPKVEKRPTTKPLSPKLGLRRNGGKKKTTKKNTVEPSEKISAFKPYAKSSNITIYNDAEVTERKDSTSLINRNKSPKKKSIDEVENRLKCKSKPKKEDQEFFEAPGGFKARPIPSSTTRRWNAGQLGIPKVSKRTLTVPVSPCLGPKRQTRIAVEGKKLKSKKKSNTSERSNGYSSSSRSTSMSPSSVQGSPLLGLNLVDSTRKEQVITKAPKIDKNITETRNEFQPFIPRSTSRATMRKQYDDYLGERRAFTIQEKRERLQSQIKSIRRELKMLGKELN